LQLSKFFPPIRGGIEAVTWELVEGLTAAGVRADVLCSNQAPFTRCETMPAGYQVVRAGSLGLLLSTSMAPPMVWQLQVRRQAYDIVHVHLPDPMAAAAVWAARPRGRLVVHWHSDVVRQRRALALYEPLQNWLLDRADGIVATSEAYARSSPALRVRQSKVSVVPIGMSDNHAKVMPRLVADIRARFGRRWLVMALGRMTYYKGFDVLIEAARLLPEDCAVVIGGEGDLLDEFRRQVASAGLAGRVHLPGHLPDDHLASYLQACDVFCMPSTLRAEAYGVAMVEAMMMARPVVASDIEGSGVPWVNQDGRTGFNVEVGNPAALAGAIRRLLDDEALRSRLGEQARRRYEEEFTAATMTQRMLALYRRLSLPTRAAAG
jgi:rhamnosyl/mannosyltransferase